MRLLAFRKRLRNFESKKGEKRADHYSTFFLPSFETYFLYEILRK